MFIPKIEHIPHECYDHAKGQEWERPGRPRGGTSQGQLCAEAYQGREKGDHVKLCLSPLLLKYSRNHAQKTVISLLLICLIS